MSVELIISLASAIVASLAGVVVYLYRLVQKLQNQLLAQSEASRQKFEDIANRQADSMHTMSQTTQEMYSKIVAAPTRRK